MLGTPAVECILRRVLSFACRDMRSRRLTAGLVAACLFHAAPADAGKARDYLNAPKDTWVTFYNLGWSQAVTQVRGGADFGIASIESEVLSQSLIITRIVGIAGRTGGFSLILPAADVRSSAGPFSERDRAFGDLGFAAEVNLFGAPALSKSEFASWTPETFSSFHLVATLPTGAYDPGSPLNVGSNRWSFASTINYSFTPDAGKTWLEVYGTARIFGTNPDAPVTGGRLEQKPLYQLEFHASRNLTPDLWVSGDAYYDHGGETELDGRLQDNAADTLRLGTGLGLRLPTIGQLMLNYDQVVSRPEGQPRGRAVRLTLARVW